MLCPQKCGALLLLAVSLGVWAESPAPRQSLVVAGEIEAQLVDLGLVLKNVSLSYRINTSNMGRASLAGSAAVLSGQLRITADDLPLSASEQHSQDLELYLQDVELAEFFALADLPGVGGDGRLSGEIPISFAEHGVQIENAWLEATKPGTLAIDSKTLSETLGGRVSEVDLVLELLKNFSYDHLKLKFNLDRDGQLSMLLLLSGRNEEVDALQPYQLNINLQSNAKSLMGVFERVRGASSDLIQLFLGKR
ncbi:MAG: YdbH domain-containing protein [Pseudomonadota bacterium]